MRFHFLTLTSLCLLLSACASAPPAASETNPVPTLSPSVAALPDVAPMIKRLTTQDGCQDFVAEMRLTAEAASGKSAAVEFQVQRQYTSDGARSLLTVLAPREETDKALLAIERAGQPTQAFSYLPGLKKLAQLGSARQLNFRGGKVTVQELLGLELNQYTHHVVARDTSAGDSLLKVEFQAAPDRQLAFPRLVGFFRERAQSPARFELYDERAQLQKILQIEEVRMIQARQTITRIVIDDLTQQLKLRLETRRIEYNRNLPRKIFSVEYLKQFVTAASQQLDQ